MNLGKLNEKCPKCGSKDKTLNRRLDAEHRAFGGGIEDSGPLTTARQFLSTRALEISVPPLASMHL